MLLCIFKANDFNYKLIEQEVESLIKSKNENDFCIIDGTSSSHFESNINCMEVDQINNEINKFDHFTINNFYISEYFFNLDKDKSYRIINNNNLSFLYQKGSYIFSVGSYSFEKILEKPIHDFELDNITDYYVNLHTNVSRRLRELADIHSHDKEWYYFRVEKKLCVKSQQALHSLIGFQFLCNRNSSDKGLVEFSDYSDTIKKTLNFIDDRIISHNFRHTDNFGIAIMMLLFRLKYEKQFNPTMTYDINNHYLIFNNNVLLNIEKQKVKIDTLNVDDKYIYIDISIPLFAELDGFYDLFYELDGKRYKLQENKRYSETSFFGEGLVHSKTFCCKIPLTKVKKESQIKVLFSGVDGKKFYYEIITGRFPSKVNSKLDDSYYAHKNELIFSLKIDTLIIKQYSKITHFIHEFKFIKSLFLKKKLYRATLMRLIYWLTKPLVNNKAIWITFDKMYKGGDNGEYFFKYVKDNHPETNIHYVMNSKYPDAQRLQNEGYRYLNQNSLKHFLYFMNADLIITTHNSIPVFSGVPPYIFNYNRNIFNAKIINIQHGLTIQDIPEVLNRHFDNISDYYIASPIEKINLLQPNYDFSKEQIHLTGLPRFDGLKDESENIILLQPTWRKNLVGKSIPGEVRAYNENFKKTNYFKVFNGMINNPDLLTILERNSYKLLFVLHPTLSSQINDFELADPKLVEVIAATDVNFEIIFKKSKVMITDYSGVQFDFAYMKKPVLYYHNPLIPSHYSNDSFNYKTQGFGPIFKDEEELIYYLDSIISSKTVDEKYQRRYEDFFAFFDHNNAKRIYNHIISTKPQ